MEEKDIAESVVDSILESKRPKKIDYDFDENQKHFRTPWDKCTVPPSVKDWTYNRRRVDDAGYVPLDKQIKRMIADGERLLDFKHSPQYRAIYEELAKADEELPQDDLLFLSRADLLECAHQLKDELETIRLNRGTIKESQEDSKIQTPEKNPPTADKETVSTKPLEG